MAHILAREALAQQGVVLAKQGGPTVVHKVWPKYVFVGFPMLGFRV